MKITEETRRICPDMCSRCFQVWTYWELCPWCENGLRNVLEAERVRVLDAVELRRAA